MTPLQVVMFFIAAPFLIAAIALVWFVIRDAFSDPNVHLLRAQWRNPDDRRPE